MIRKLWLQRCTRCDHEFYEPVKAKLKTTERIKLWLRKNLPGIVRPCDVCGKRDKVIIKKVISKKVRDA